MATLASPTSSRPMRWCSASRAPGQRSCELAGDARKGLQRQRLERFVLQMLHPPAGVVVAHQPQKRHDRTVGSAPIAERGNERVQLERRRDRWPEGAYLQYSEVWRRSG